MPVGRSREIQAAWWGFIKYHAQLDILEKSFTDLLCLQRLHSLVLVGSIDSGFSV